MAFDLVNSAMSPPRSGCDLSTAVQRGIHLRRCDGDRRLPRRLGVSHCTRRRYFKAVPGSTHGYDVADPTRLNPEIGDRADYARWIDALRAHGMGHILDVVPNHMGIADRRTRGGRTCWRTARLALRAILRHRLAPAQDRARRTRCCCRCWATSTARCSNGRRSRSSTTRARFALGYYDDTLPDRAGHLRRDARPSSASGCSRTSAKSPTPASNSRAS